MTICVSQLGLIRGKTNSFYLFAGGCFATWCQEHAGVRLLPSHRNWEIGVLCPLMYISKRELPGLCKRHSSVIKLTNCLSSLQKDLCTFQRKEKYLTMVSFQCKRTKKKVERETFFPYFQQSELSLLF